MWYPATVTVPASAEPVTLNEAQAHLRAALGVGAEDAEMYLASARAHVEAYCGARFATQTVVVKCDGWADMARLPEAPVHSVTSISYVDTAGATQTLATSVYELRADGLDAAIVLKYGQTWPAIQPGSRITLTAVVGYATVPPPVKHAMLLHLGWAYEQREPIKSEWSSFDSLLCNYRRGA